MKHFQTMLRVSTASWLVAVAVPAMAQTADAQAAGDAQAAQALTNDIVVTARRREESLQTVPVAVTAISGDQLARRNVNQASDLVTLVPSLQIQPATSQRQSGSVTIRGQGQAYTGVLPAVISYLADVPLDPNGGAAFSTLDVQNVQVLRGPQGTLFGRNTTGGAVLFVPKAPGDHFEGTGSVSVGNYGYVNIRAAVTVPITPTLSIRLAGESLNRNGFTKNLYTGRALDNQNQDILRAFIRWEPIEGLRNDLIISNLRADESGTGYIMHELLNNGRAAYNYQGGALRTIFAQQQARGPRAVDSNEDLGARRRLFFLADTLSYEFAPGLTVKNIFGYQRIKTCYGTDLDGSQVPFNISTCFPNRFQRAAGLKTYDDTDLNQFTNELQIAGTVLDNRLDFIVGGFFLDVRTPGGLDQFRLNRVSKSAQSVNLGSTVIADSSRALFAQGTYKLLDNLKVTGGFRYTWDTRKASTGTLRSLNEGATYSCASPSLPDQPHTPADPASSCYTKFDAKFSDYGYTFGVDWQVTPKTLIYAATRRGYKSGGFNTVTAVTLTSFGPETLTDYELGVKTDWSAGIFQGRINADVFYGKYDNIQRNFNVLIDGASTTVIQSAAKASIWGIEVEGFLKIGDNFELSGFYSHLDPKYKRGTYTQPTTGLDISGSAFQALAKDSGSITGRFYTELEDGSEMSLSGTMYTTSKIAFSSDTISNPTAFAPGYTIFNANFDLRKAFGSNFDLGLWVRNLTNKDYVVGGLGLASVLGVTYRIYGEPRMFGATGTYHF